MNRIVLIILLSISFSCNTEYFSKNVKKEKSQNSFTVIKSNIFLKNYILKKEMKKLESKKDDNGVELNQEFKDFFKIKKLTLGN